MRKALFIIMVSGCFCILCGCLWFGNSRGQTSIVVTESRPGANEMLELAISYEAMYQDMDKGTAFNTVISEESVLEIVNHLAAEGHTVTAYMQDMRNHQPFDVFLQKAMKGQVDSACLYRVNEDGGFTRFDYQSMDGRLYLTTQTLVWDEKMVPHVQPSGDPFVIEEWVYTDKGFLIYETNRSPLCHMLLRVLPLGEEKRDLCKKYIAPIGYSGNNLFLTDWTPENWTEIAFNDLYDALLYFKTGNLPEYDLSLEQVCAMDFEPLFRQYLGVSSSYLRENAIYYEVDEAYFWNYPTCAKHDILFPSPVPEVVDFGENDDGTFTLTVDVMDMYQGDDRVFSHELTIRVYEDGSFKYVSNCIRPDDLENVPSYTPRSALLDNFSYLDMPN